MVAGGGGGLDASAALHSIFPPGQDQDGRVEQGERDQSDGRVERDPVQLVADKQGQDRNHPRARPQLVEKQRDDQDDLDEAVGEEIDGTEQDGWPGEPCAVCSR